MKRHDQLTILRNIHRARELRTFREMVDSYFERSQCDPDGVPVDWAGAQAARSRIHQLLPRIIAIVRAADLGGPGESMHTDPGPTLGRVEVLQQIFSARYADGVDQEIFDVLDMAIGVYESGRAAALVRTVNPFHHLGTALAFVARAPRALLGAFGLRRRPEPLRLRPADVVRLEAVAARLEDVEELIDTKLAAVQERQGHRHGEQARQLAELAERLDFAERMLARQPPAQQIPAPGDTRITTPV